MTASEAERTLRRWSPKRLYPAFGAVIAIALGLVVYAASNAATGNEATSRSLPDHVERLIPESGTEVLAQSMIGIDLEVGYTAELVLNGTTLSTSDGVLVNEELATVTFKPTSNSTIERLDPEENCVEARVRPVGDASVAPSPVFWCFTVA